MLVHSCRCFLVRHLFIVSLIIGLSGCTKVFFQPSSNPSMFPDKLGLQYEEHLFSGQAGSLYGWWIPAHKATSKTVLFAHGNAGNVSTHLGFVHWLPKHGYNVFMFDYRGYGRSEGVPSTEGIVEDTLSAMEWLSKKQLISPKDTVIYAHSLGAAAVIPAVAKSEKKLDSDYAGLVLDSAFLNYQAVAKATLAKQWWTWWLQPLVPALIDKKPNSEKSIQDIQHVPMAIAHSKTDSVIPYIQGRNLFDSAPKPKVFYTLKSAQHNHGWQHAEDRNWFLLNLKQWLQ